MATYTFTSLSDTSVLILSVGNKSTERAAKPATKSATVVKKPKTAWARFSVECIVYFSLCLPVGGRDPLEERCPEGMGWVGCG